MDQVEKNQDFTKMECASNTSEQPLKNRNLNLFRIEMLMSAKMKKAAFCESGARKLLAVVSEENLFFHFTGPTGSYCQLNYAWDFAAFPIQNLCFEPSGTWLLVICRASLHLLPFLSLFEPDGIYDQKWLLNDMTTIKLDNWVIATCVASVWWLTKSLQHIAIIGEQSGEIKFYNLDDCAIVGTIKLLVEICDLQICVDDSLDFITLLAYSEEKQWRLILEHRSMNYNWLEPTSMLVVPELPTKKEGFMATLKQYGAEKMAMLSQRRNPAQTEESAIKPVNYTKEPTSYSVRDFQLTKMWDLSLTECEDGWFIAPQYSDGRHFVSAYNSTLNTLILQNVEGGGAAHVLRIRRDGHTDRLFANSKVLWCQRLLYLYGSNWIEIHSTHFASESSMESSSMIWDHELDGNILRVWRIAPNLQLPQCTLANLIGPKPPQILLDRCLVVTTKAAYMISTVCDPCEWLVGVICSTVDVNIGLDCQKIAQQQSTPSDDDMKEEPFSPFSSPKRSYDHSGIGGIGEHACSALAAPVREIVRAAATLLLASGAMSKATRLYRLCIPSMSGWAEVAGALGRWRAVAACPVQHQERTTRAATEDLLPHALARLLLDTTDIWRKNTFVELVEEINRWDFVASSPEIWTVCSALGAWKQLRALQDHFCTISVPVSYVPSIENKEDPEDLTENKDEKEMPRYLCRGAWSWLISSRGGVRQFFRRISKNCAECSSCQYCKDCGTDRGLTRLLNCALQQQHLYDDELLKAICMWLCPFQEEMRPLLKVYMVGYGRCLANELQLLIKTFLSICCTICSRNAPPLLASMKLIPFHQSRSVMVQSNQNKDLPVISCSTTWWGISYQGVVQFGGTLPPGIEDFDFCGLNVMTVACGRDHALLLTTDGLFAAGDNRFGQLGCGKFGGGGCWSLVIGGVRGALVTDVSAGQYHSAVLTSRGHVYTWGWGVHGQLGHGGQADDECRPVRVTRVSHVKSVKCGAHHTAVITEDHSVWVWGAGVFGQLGNGKKDKCSLPCRVDLGDLKVISIAAGHFHTLALTEDGNVWTWGCSPQSLRIGTTSRKIASVSSEPVENPPSTPSSPVSLPKERHLSPRLVDISNVTGRVIAASGGWNHSCLVDDRGNLYMWGLSLDGQLGTGDRKEVLLPTKVSLMMMPRDSQKCTEDLEKSHSAEPKCTMAACGGDFTFAVDRCGTIFKTGNKHDQNWSGPVRVVKMKTNNRIIRLPGRPPSDLIFTAWNHLDNTSSFEVNILSNSEAVLVNENPLRSIKSFANFEWADSILEGLEPWIEDDLLQTSPFLMARFYLLCGDYKRSLLHQLNHQNVNLSVKPEKIYCVHSGRETIDNVEIARKVISGRIKEVCKALLNEESPAECRMDSYKPIQCLCVEENAELNNYFENVYGREADDLNSSSTINDWQSAAAVMLSMSPDPASTADVLIKWMHAKRKREPRFISNIDNMSDKTLHGNQFNKTKKFSKEDIAAMEFALCSAGNDAAAEIALFSPNSELLQGLLSPEFYLTQCDLLFSKWGD